MTRIQELEEKVKKLYEQGHTGRGDWADWLWQNHVQVVADYASDLAEKYNAHTDMSRAAALLHDVADAIMKRSNPNHEKESLKIARELMKECGYENKEIALVVDDAIRYHSCKEGERPESLEGKVLATADALAHLKTDFYIYGTWVLGKDKTLAEVKGWVLVKIERDFNDKIFFDEVREDSRSDYELIKTLFSR